MKKTHTPEQIIDILRQVERETNQGKTVAEAAHAALLALLAGGVILNVLKEELPEERKSRFWPFALGAATYAVLLLLT